MPTNPLDDNYYGSPFAWVSSDPTENFGDMDTNYFGSPFVTVTLTEPPPSAHKIKTINFTLLTAIGSIMGVPVANLKTYNGVSDV